MKKIVSVIIILVFSVSMVFAGPWETKSGGGGGINCTVSGTPYCNGTTSATLTGTNSYLYLDATGLMKALTGNLVLVGFDSGGLPTTFSSIALGDNAYMFYNVTNSAIQYNIDLSSAAATKTSTKLGRAITQNVTAASATATLTAHDLSGTFLNNFGQTTDTILTLPTADQGMNTLFSIAATPTKTFGIKLASPGYGSIYLDGVAATNGATANNVSTMNGNGLAIWAVQTGANTYRWQMKSTGATAWTAY